VAILNNQTVSVKLNTHTLGELTSDKDSQVKNYIKSKKLNIKNNEKDFADAINYYNTISSSSAKK
jgi:pterin-4a-carbinolamine dehydratase